MPINPVKSVVAPSAGGSRNLFEHERQLCGLDLISQVCCPLILHGPPSVSCELVPPVAFRVPQVFFSRPALPANNNPTESIKVDVSGDVLKQWLCTDPADGCWYASQRVH